MTWNPLGKKACLTTKPLLSQGLATHLEDRELEMGFVRLQEMEDKAKKLYKEVKRFEECVLSMHKLEQKMASDLSNSSVCHEDESLRKVAEDYQSAVYQMGHTTDDLSQLAQKTVVEPVKKLGSEFAAVAAAIKRRDAALIECQKCQAKYEKQSKLEKTGANVVKTEQFRRSLQSAKTEFDSQNRLLVMELPQFYDKRVDYFQPCLQSLIRSQVDYYGETTRLFTHLISSRSRSDSTTTPQEEANRMLTELRALSIVGN